MSAIDTIGKFLSPCRNLKVIANKRGELVSVPCGTCPDCVARNSFKYRSLAIQEAIQSQFVVFFTLTYDERFVPIVKLVSRNTPGFNVAPKRVVTHNGKHITLPSKEYLHGRDWISCVDITRRPIYKNGKVVGYEMFDTYNKEICTINSSFYDKKFREFYNKSRVKSKLYKSVDLLHDGYSKLRVIRHKDLQNFLKRLRFQVSKISDDKIRQFCVSEYGPETFRPHFHGLLYFDDPKVKTCILELINKCWKYGSIDAEFANSKQSCCYYVTSYLNSFSHLPDYLRADAIRPKIVHSNYFGTKPLRELKQYIYDDVRRGLEEFKHPTTFGDFTYRPTTSNVFTLFPKCYNYGGQGLDDVYKLYTCYFHYSHQSNRLVSEIVRDIMLFPNDDFYTKRFLSLLDIVPPGTTLLNYAGKNDVRLILPHTNDVLDVFDKRREFTEYELRIYNRIYSALHTSKHFITFCCDNKPTLFRSTIFLIFDFYNKRNQFNLKRQYVLQQEYHEKCTLTTDYSIFYPVGSLDYKRSYYLSPLIKSVNAERDEQYQKMVKHHKQNDANKIFVDVKLNIN